MDPLIITVAPVGAEVTKEHNPNVPYTPEEIAEECYRAWNEGASIAHIHARNPDGTSTQDPDVYARIIELVKAKTDLIIQVSVGGAVGMTVEERVGPNAIPDIEFFAQAMKQHGVMPEFEIFEAGMIFFAQAMKQHGVMPEFEIFEAGMIETAKRLAKKGLVELPGHFDFVMGVPGAISGIGRHELPLGAMAIVLGGHVRVGFEDNVYYSRGVKAESNAQLVARMARLANELGRPVASPDEARKILRLPRKA